MMGPGFGDSIAEYIAVRALFSIAIFYGVLRGLEWLAVYLWQHVSIVWQ